jgi:hypothetical protein
VEDFLWTIMSWFGVDFWSLSRLELRSGRGSGANEILDLCAEESSSLALTLVLDPSTVFESGK